LVLRLFRPDKIVPAVQQYIIKQMGQQFVEPPTFDLPGSYADSFCITPLIFVLSPGADPMMALLKFGETMGVFDERIKTVSLGQGQVYSLNITFHNTKSWFYFRVLMLNH
jgi:dynein heavy chain